MTTRVTGNSSCLSGSAVVLTSNSPRRTFSTSSRRPSDSRLRGEGKGVYSRLRKTSYGKRMNGHN
ncbi:hypothetical protein E2C01_095574 [Portunus trituberculatus]|uniref:Uncharacterized protein n=1 Tax=Portunus trituberculatus TaxID=210409 RepID=A0A5B7JQ65_PORTR|nr:hypothetical protein [Portunus trituberculatus]